VTYGDNNKGKILGTGTISNGSSFDNKNVLLVKGLKHNLISISQLCDKGHKVIFGPSYCLIFDALQEKALLPMHYFPQIFFSWVSGIFPMEYFPQIFFHG